MKILYEVKENKNWKSWQLGDSIEWYGTEFDGSFSYIGNVIKKFDDHLIVFADGMSLWVDDDTISQYRKIN